MSKGSAASQDVQESDSDFAELPEYELQQSSDCAYCLRKASNEIMLETKALTVHHLNTTVPRPTLEGLAEFCTMLVG